MLGIGSAPEFLDSFINFRAFEKFPSQFDAISAMMNDFMIRKLI